MALLKTTILDGAMEMVLGTAEDEDTVGIGVVDGVDPAKPHLYFKVDIKAGPGDRMGDAQLKALKAARDMIGAEISRITALQQAL